MQYVLLLSTCLMMECAQGPANSSRQMKPNSTNQSGVKDNDMGLNNVTNLAATMSTNSDVEPQTSQALQAIVKTLNTQLGILDENAQLNIINEIPIIPGATPPINPDLPSQSPAVQAIQESANQGHTGGLDVAEGLNTAMRECLEKLEEGNSQDGAECFLGSITQIVAGAAAVNKETEAAPKPADNTKCHHGTEAKRSLKFDDIDNLPSAIKTKVNEAKNIGLFAGTGKADEPITQFSPDTHFTRAQAVTIQIGMITMVCREDTQPDWRTAVPKDEIPSLAAELFPNETKLVSSYWGTNNILRATQMGLISGYTDGTFKPEDPVTNGQLYIMLHNTAQWMLENCNNPNGSDETKREFLKALNEEEKKKNFVKGEEYMQTVNRMHSACPQLESIQQEVLALEGINANEGYKAQLNRAAAASISQTIHECYAPLFCNP